jgi:hypothetical protein
MTMSSLTPELRLKIVALLQKGESSSIVQTVKQLFKLLIEHGLLHNMQINSKFIGCHPSNRDGYGINGHDVHSLASDIFALGFDKDAVKAVCVELLSSDSAARDWNEELVAGQGHLLAPACKEHLRYGTLWGGHTNQVLRAVLAACEHEDAGMTLDGKLNLAKIREHDPDFGDAVENGVVWQVLPAWLLDQFPGMSEMIQAAGNASGQVAKAEHELQVLRKINNAFTLLSGPDGSARVDFSDVKLRVMRSKPPCAASLPGMYSFSLRHGGGKEAALTKDTELFVRAKAGSARTVSPDFWDALAMDAKGQEQASRFRHGVLKLVYTCPINVVKNECKLITTADVKKLLTKDIFPKVLVADSLIRQVRVIADDSQLGCVKTLDAISKMEMDLVMFVMEKKHKDWFLPPSLGAVAGACVETLSSIAGVGILNPWLTEIVAASIAAGPTAIPRALTGVIMRDLSSDGKLRNECALVVEKGFSVGMTVARKADKIVGTIQSIAASGVVIRVQGAEGKMVVGSLDSFGNGEWAEFTPKAEPEELLEWHAHAPHVSPLFDALLHKGEIAMQMHDLDEKHAAVLIGSKVFVKPKKDVVASKAFALHKLILVPSTVRVDCKSDCKDVVPSGCVDVGCHGGMRFWLTGANQLPKKADAGFIAPYWFVHQRLTRRQPTWNLSAPLAARSPS